MTYAHPLPNGGTLTTKIDTASEASIKAGLAEIARVAALVAPVSQVDAVVGEQALAILERLRNLLGVASIGAVEAGVERLAKPETVTAWPTVALDGRWLYHQHDRESGHFYNPAPGRWTTVDEEVVFVSDAGLRWYLSDFISRERFTRIREGK